jgi:DNA polymerase/3'-5' exonuclease PolX
MTDERPKFPRSVVLEVMLDLGKRFDPQPAWNWDGEAPSTGSGPGGKPVQRPHALCERLCGVGGYRRGKREMKDLELLYIPRCRTVTDAGDMFGAQNEIDVTERLLEELVALRVLELRLNKDGARCWGPWNKHAVHVDSGLPIDLFAATPENWFNRLVVTTGPPELNVRIAAEARKRSWEWEVNQPGFVPLGGKWEECPRERRTMRSERAVFEFVGFEFLPPEERK